VTPARPAALAAIALCLAAAGPAPARADDGPRPLRYDVRRDLALTGASLAVTLGAELAKERLAPSSCRWCEPPALDARARDLLVLGYGKQAARVSDLTVGLVLPAGIVAHQLLAARDAGGSARDGWVDVLLVTEAVAISTNLNQLVKFAVARQRPFVRYGNFAEPGRTPDPDDDLSFYSGHTSTAFALATAAATVSHLRGYRSTPWVLGGGLGVATVVGYLRIAADKHYLTDVLTGAAAGAAIGWAVPWLLHRPRGGGAAGAGVAAVPWPVGFVVAF
jgi:membrane-associated phospholipid phosphatase